MSTRFFAGAMLFVGLTAGHGIGTALAQADSSASDTVTAAKHLKRPVLGTHRFIPNPLVKDPFPRTYVRNTLGVGTAVDVPIVPDFIIGTDTIAGVQGDLLFALLDFEYSQRIKEWMGFWVTAKLRGRLGNDVGALVAEGVTLNTAFDIGWMFKFLETDRTAMSATVQVSKGDFTGINLAEYIRGVIEDQRVPLVRTVPTLWTGTGLRFAWAANRWLGLTANGTLLYGESPNRSKDAALAWVLGAGTSLDFTSLIHVPVGLALGLRLASTDPNGETSSSAEAVLVRIAYTGRDDFVIALDLAGQHSTLFSGSTVNIGLANVSMRYYF